MTSQVAQCGNSMTVDVTCFTVKLLSKLLSRDFFGECYKLVSSRNENKIMYSVENSGGVSQCQFQVFFKTR